MPHLDFLIAAKLEHLVSDVVFEALNVLFVGAAVDEVEEGGASAQKTSIYINSNITFSPILLLDFLKYHT